MMGGVRGVGPGVTWEELVCIGYSESKYSSRESAPFPSERLSEDSESFMWISTWDDAGALLAFEAVSSAGKLIN